MTREEFEKDVRDFILYYVSEYARGTPAVSFDYEDEEFWRAAITFEARGRTWVVPVSMMVGSGRPGIEIGEDPYPELDLDGEGLYVYLWHAACDQLDVCDLYHKQPIPRAL